MTEQVNYSLGLIEVKALGHAIQILDVMLKAGEVEFVACERKLGGWLVSLVVRGELSAVKAAVDAGVARAEELGCLKVHDVIARPHYEILKFLHLDGEDEETPNAESAATHVVHPTVKEAPNQKKSAEAEAKKPAPRRRGRKPKATAEGSDNK